MLVPLELVEVFWIKLPFVSYVSVVCADSGLGDALSTALFCMTLEEGQALIASIPGAAAHWVAIDGIRTASDGWSQYVKQ